ncbi:hypothetical protein JCM16161A_12790 [Vulcanisaeta sp. JCM 16161]|uniref:hypothetical protein n=1 Tax=Vulcanisaeta sp. JCM 16161 TaxID=1295372 RepID=UPI0006D1E4D5|nr:hypothetical protein [Vulcanisaeta sp. JCM 16161]
MIKRMIVVEDTYGVGFHRELIRKLGISTNPEVRRLPAGKCSNALRRKVLASAVTDSIYN